METREKVLQNLMESGNELLSPPSSIEQLLPLLNRLENCLKGMEQSQSNCSKTVLGPVMKALTATTLLNHFDVDVRVIVASCITQILRITAPDPPFVDEQMKDIFRLIVATFENISDTLSCSYERRISILEDFALSRPFIVMLDVGCDSLILEMFNLFFQNIRETHPDIVFASMGIIMIEILEEIEEIPPELLSPLLDSVRNGNQNVLPIARKLGERVILNCHAKLRRYMHQAVQSMGFPLGSYSRVVAFTCGPKSEAMGYNEDDFHGKYLCFLMASMGHYHIAVDIKAVKLEEIINGFAALGLEKVDWSDYCTMPFRLQELGTVLGTPPDGSSGCSLRSRWRRKRKRACKIKGTSNSQKKRSGKKVDAENCDAVKLSVMRDAMFRQIGAKNKSRGKQLKQMQPVKQWGLKKGRSERQKKLFKGFK